MGVRRKACVDRCWTNPLIFLLTLPPLLFSNQALSQDLLRTTLEIPFSVPPYMSLLARSVATLEGIALLGDPNYQMVAQVRFSCFFFEAKQTKRPVPLCRSPHSHPPPPIQLQAYPFVVRKVLRNSSAGIGSLLRDIVFDAGTGAVQVSRLSALLNAALGYVADRVDGFVDLDAVPEEGAPLQDIVAFLLSPEARDLRPLLVDELVEGLDLLARDRLRRAYGALPSLAPRLPFIGSLPMPPLPPVPVPGIGFMAVKDVVDALGPPLDAREGIYLQSAGALADAVAGEGGLPNDVFSLARLLLDPTDQARELGAALATASGDAASRAVVQEIADAVVARLAERQAGRLGVPVDTLFPGLGLARSLLLRGTGGGAGGALPPPDATA